VAAMVARQVPPVQSGDSGGGCRADDMLQLCMPPAALAPKLGMRTVHRCPPMHPAAYLFRLHPPQPYPQLERKGYYIVDAPFTAADKPIVLLNIPDGRSRVFPGMPAP